MSRRRSTSLTASLEFERVYRKGWVHRGRLFSVHVLPNSVGNPRLGLSVSRKVGTAVRRNAVRRRLKEIFRSLGPGLTGELDLVVSAKPAAAEASFQELNEEFLRFLRKLDRDFMDLESEESAYNNVAP
jgi:ribonuclease P protein component